ncbi:hypothetical protein [Thermotoga profunda]|uniref:hypothetical protein n=1 Tax=Thermotoga profunda TaxID=1508420 RepID=UPI001185BC56|nr:hypothetical protein [Thermotoga profunda]
MVITLEVDVMKLDPIKKLLKRYPRILVIKAALIVLSTGQKVSAENIEKAINDIMETDDESRD